MSFYSSHLWQNGAVITVLQHSDTEVNIRIQNDKEEMLADIIMGHHEAICLMAAITSVMSKKDDEDYYTALLKRNQND